MKDRVISKPEQEETKRTHRERPLEMSESWTKMGFQFTNFALSQGTYSNFYTVLIFAVNLSSSFLWGMPLNPKGLSNFSSNFQSSMKKPNTKAKRKNFLQRLFNMPYFIVGCLFLGIAIQTFCSWASEAGSKTVKKVLMEDLAYAENGAYHGLEYTEKAGEYAYKNVGEWATSKIDYAIGLTKNNNLIVI